MHTCVDVLITIFDIYMMSPLGQLWMGIGRNNEKPGLAPHEMTE